MHLIYLLSLTEEEKNEPAMVKYVVNYLAELWNESPEQVAKITTNNFFGLFTKLELKEIL